MSDSTDSNVTPPPAAHSEREKTVGKKAVSAEDTGVPLNVPRKQIKVERNWNVRTGIEQKKVDDLALGISVDGLNTPIEVRENEKKPGKYCVTKGFTRLEALDMLADDAKRAALEVRTGVKNIAAWEGPIPVIVKGYLNEGFALLANLTENTNRNSVRMADEAKRYADLEKNHGISRKAMALRAGVTDKQVGLLIRCWNNLHPTIVELWANPTAQTQIPLPLLQQWVPLKQEEQLARFTVWLNPESETPEGEQEESAGGGGGGGEGEGSGTVAASAPNKRTIKAKLEALLETEKEAGADATLKAQIAAIKWVLGLRKKFDPSK